jgi:hypothetical protein
MQIFAVEIYRYPPRKTAFGEDLNEILQRITNFYLKKDRYMLYYTWKVGDSF